MNESLSLHFSMTNLFYDDWLSRLDSRRVDHTSCVPQFLDSIFCRSCWKSPPCHVSSSWVINCENNVTDHRSLHIRFIPVNRFKSMGESYFLSLQDKVLIRFRFIHPVLLQPAYWIVNNLIDRPLVIVVYAKYSKKWNGQNKNVYFKQIRSWDCYHFDMWEVVLQQPEK